LGIKARHIWDEWRSVQNCQHDNPSTAIQQQQLNWQKPPWGWHKCNVDAEFYNALNKTDAGWCVRNHTDTCNFVLALGRNLLEDRKVLYNKRGSNRIA
jgi:hypothetical protein